MCPMYPMYPMRCFVTLFNSQGLTLKCIVRSLLTVSNWCVFGHSLSDYVTIVSVLLLDIGVIRAQSIGCCACSRMCLTVHVYGFRRSKMPGGKNKKKQHFKRHVYPREKTKEVNPFELKVNRQKHEVLGRKVSKTDKGMPGVSRSKAIKKVC